MGSCLSKNAVADEETVNAAPHPEARRMWIVATPLDSADIPEDLAGIDADGLKSALRNRGMETEHWALKVDPLLPHKTSVQAHIFDITLEGGKLAANVQSPSSPYWNAIHRRVILGWTTWKDEEIIGAQKLLITARPKYDGRTNNFQQLARLLAKHIEFVLPATTSASAPSPASGSSMTLVSAPMSASSLSADSKVNKEHGTTASRISQRVSVSRPPLVQLPTAPAAMISQPEQLQLDASKSSSRLSLPPPMQHRQHSQPAPSDHRQTYRQSTYDPATTRTRTTSDASRAFASQRGGAVEEVDGLQTTPQRRSRRRSEAPAAWLATESPKDTRSSSVRARSSQRDSVFSLGGGSVYGNGGYAGTWGPNSNMVSHSPSMPTLRMPMYAMPPPPQMWPGGVMHPGMMQPPMQFYPNGMSFMPGMSIMPMLAPPSPGFHSHASSGVPTPPESPHLSTTHLAKVPVAEFDAPLSSRPSQLRI